MPEGPEIFKASLLINNACKDKIFTGKVVKSEVNWKNPDIPFSASSYTITSESRGKELMLTLCQIDEEKYSVSSAKLKNGKFCNGKDRKVSNKAANGKYPKRKIKEEIPAVVKSEMLDESDNNTEIKAFDGVVEDSVHGKKQCLNILFRFGMSGKFMFTTQEPLHKHAHLMFYTKDDPSMVLSFVDVRRFGRWEITDSWSPNRSPDPMKNYKEFRENVLKNLSDTVFNKPICEVLNNQKYFNGIGNYLRAEILYRAGIPPFEQARKALEPLMIKKEDSKKPDLLELCHLVPSEVIELPGAGYDPEGKHSDYAAFNNWLRCYYNPDMQNLVDGDGRTIWFKGNPGPHAPKVKKSRGIVKSRKRKQGKESESEEKEENKADEMGNKKKQKKRNASSTKAVNKRSSKHGGPSKRQSGKDDKEQEAKQERRETRNRKRVSITQKSAAKTRAQTSKSLKQPRKLKSQKAANTQKARNTSKRKTTGRKRTVK